MLEYRHRGGDYIYEVVLIVILPIIVYNCLDKYLINKKGKNIVGNINENPKLKLKSMPHFINRYLSNIRRSLLDLSNPFGLSLKKYIFIKYVLSIVFFIVSIINKNNSLVSITILVIVYFMPNILIKIFKNNERILVIKNLRKIVNAIIISLSASLTLEDSIKSCVEIIDYIRLKKEFEIFIRNYRIYGYNMRKAITILKQKFNYYEVELFLSTLLNGESDGNLMESLEKYNMVLDMSYSKYLAKEKSNRLLYLTFGTILSLINIIIIVMYPMFIEVTENLKMIFS